MHIPENYLSPETCAVMAAAMVPVWYKAVKKVKETVPKEKMPLLGIFAAFSFLSMMFNIPLPGGTETPESKVPEGEAEKAESLPAAFSAAGKSRAAPGRAAT